MAGRGGRAPARCPGRLRRWHRWSDPPLTAAAGLYLMCYALPIVLRRPPPALVEACRLTALAVWALFVADLAVRVVAAVDRRAYLRRHWPDVLVVLLPALRPLADLRAVTALGVLGRRGHPLGRGRLLGVAVLASAMVCLVAALAVLDAERRSGAANIRDLGDALWWTVSTVTTVGYGDHYPTTGGGRLVAVVLMIAGITLIGVVTATLASWFVARFAPGRSGDARLVERIDALTREVSRMRRDLDRIADRTTRQEGTGEGRLLHR